jgi:hypothetical protein
MKMSQMFLVCVCFLGAAQLASSQTKATAIPGFYNPTTGKFTTHIDAGARAQPASTPATTATPIFFREQFNITITNYDQPSSWQAVCSVSIGSDDEGGYGESAAVVATAVGSGWTCSVPILTLWMLQTPATDSIYADVSVDIYSPSATPVNGYYPAYRESDQSLTLPQPGNSQTVENAVAFSL